MAADPLIGAVLAGHRIEAVIGRGGMGAVYRGRHLRLDKARAIKLLPPDLAADEAFRSRFEREWRAAAEIDHPSIVEVLDAGEQDGRLYIVMRLVDGVDLHELIAKEGALAPERAVALLGPVAEALDAAHERGLIHRDVKPSNILVAGDRAYLSDFGIAKSSTTRGLTKTGLFIGTVDYAAPEQIESRPLDRRTDVYALGGVLYSCLTGAPPYERDTDLQVLLAQLHDPVPTPSEKRSDLPAGLDTVVGRAMAKPMDERYSTCGELLEEARGVLRSQPTALAAAAVATKIDPAVLSELPRIPETELARPPETELAPPASAATGGRRGRRGLLLALLAGAVLIGATAAGAAILFGGSDTVDAVGRVVDARTGKPVAGVSVKTDAVAEVTGTDGRFSIEDLPGDATLGFASCAYAPRQVAADAVGSSVRLKPLPVSGTVTSALTGRPIAATVREGGRTARTNAAGSYRLYGTCPGSERRRRGAGLPRAHGRGRRRAARVGRPRRSEDRPGDLRQRPQLVRGRRCLDGQQRGGLDGVRRGRGLPRAGDEDELGVRRECRGLRSGDEVEDREAILRPPGDAQVQRRLDEGHRRRLEHGGGPDVQREERPLLRVPRRQRRLLPGGQAPPVGCIADRDRGVEAVAGDQGRDGHEPADRRMSRESCASPPRGERADAHQRDGHGPRAGLPVDLPVRRLVRHRADRDRVRQSRLYAGLTSGSARPWSV